MYNIKYGNGKEWRADAMKVRWNDKYLTVSVYACIVILFAVVCGLFFYNIGDFGSILSGFFSAIAPLIYGFAIAYILNPVMVFFETKVFKKMSGKSGKLRTRRALSVTCAMLILLIIVSLFFIALVPAISDGVKELLGNYENYIENLQNRLRDWASRSEFLSKQLENVFDKVGDFFENISEVIEKYISTILSYSISVVRTVTNIIIGIVISFYFLYSKEKCIAQLKKIAKAFLSDKTYERRIYELGVINRAFNGFIVGKLLDSMVIGLISLIVLGIFGFPYVALLSFIIFITNIIPVFGPVIGGIIGGVILLLVAPEYLIGFVIYVFIIQQIDGNIIGPAILGGNVGLSGLWIICSITVMSGIFGVPGMLIGVPTFAAAYMLFKSFVEGKLKKKGLSPDTKDYYATEEAYEIFRGKDEMRFKRFTERPLVRKAMAAFKKKFGKKRKPVKKASAGKPVTAANTASKPKPTAETAPKPAAGTTAKPATGTPSASKPTAGTAPAGTNAAAKPTAGTVPAGTTSTARPASEIAADGTAAAADTSSTVADPVHTPAEKPEE